MAEIYNRQKLPEYYFDWHSKKVLVVGTGAVGSYLVESLAKMGIGKLYCMDFDEFSEENTAKHSCLIRYPEDVGKNKAQAVAMRAQKIMIEGGKAIGIDKSITTLGPMIFARMHVIALALDNYAAKIYANQIWLQIPKEKRPLLVFGGTIYENAQSNCLDGKEACMRCLFDESWLEQPEKRTSCSGLQYREVEGVQQIVKTTGQASRIAADCMAEQIRAYFLNVKNTTNQRMLYSAYPNLSLSVVHPMKRDDCPDCRQYHPPKSIRYLPGSVGTMTIGELFNKLKDSLGTEEFEVNVPVIEFAQITYGGLIVSARCPACGKKLDNIYCHEFNTYHKDLVCEECRKTGREPRYDVAYQGGEVVRAISPKSADEYLLEKTLFNVGWSFGGYISVLERPADAVDIFDDRIKQHIFACTDDISFFNKL